MAWDWELTSELQLTASHSWAGTLSSSSIHRYQNTKMTGCMHHLLGSQPPHQLHEQQKYVCPGHIWHQEYCYIYTYFVAGELHCLQPFAANNAGTCGIPAIPLQLFSFPEHFPHATTVWERDRPGRANNRSAAGHVGEELFYILGTEDIAS